MVVKGLTMTHVAFIENCICVICKVTTMLLIGRLLYYAMFKSKTFKTRQPSSAMVMLFFVHFVGSTSSVAYNCYLIVYWHASGNEYDIYAVYWTGIFHSIYVAVAPIAVFFLTLERCLVLMFSLNFESRLKRLALSLSIVTLFIAVVICVTFTLLELPLNQDANKCGTFTCSVLTYRGLPQLAVKTSFGSANLMGTFVLIWLVKRNKQASCNANNRAIRVTVFLEVCLCVIPGYCNVIMVLVLPRGYSPSAFLGEYPAMLLAVDAMVCSVYYTWLFLNRQTVRCWQTTTSTVLMVSAPNNS